VILTSADLPLFTLPYYKDARSSKYLTKSDAPVPAKFFNWN
jgi:hypothetical protein